MHPSGLFRESWRLQNLRWINLLPSGPHWPGQTRQTGRIGAEPDVLQFPVAQKRIHILVVVVVAAAERVAASVPEDEAVTDARSLCAIATVDSRPARRESQDAVLERGRCVLEPHVLGSVPDERAADDRAGVYPVGTGI